MTLTALASGIRRPGIYMLPAARYHADPIVRPSLSHSILRTLLDKSPRHAWWSHPRLNPDRPADDPSPAMIDGTVLHRIILGRGEAVQIIDADSYRTKEAREERDAAMARGVTPILAGRFAELQTCADAVLAQLRDDPEAETFFAPGRSEAIAVCRIGPVWCRAMIDRLPNAGNSPLWDIKSTGQSARPEDWERALAKRYASQAAFYRFVTGHALKRPAGEMRFVVFEKDPPYALSIVACGETMIEAAEAEIMRGIKQWATCIVTGEWPGYGRGVHRIEAPVHMLLRAEEAKLDFGRIAA